MTLDGREVVQVKGDADDVFSHGFICPKATGLKHLHDDPDRLRDAARAQATTASCARRAGTRRSRSIDERLMPLIEEHGRNAVAVYLGNPSAHNLSARSYGPAMAARARHAQRLLGELGRPDAQARVRRA